MKKTLCAVIGGFCILALLGGAFDGAAARQGGHGGGAMGGGGHAAGVRAFGGGGMGAAPHFNAGSAMRAGPPPGSTFRAHGGRAHGGGFQKGYDGGKTVGGGTVGPPPGIRPMKPVIGAHPLPGAGPIGQPHRPHHKPHHRPHHIRRLPYTVWYDPVYVDEPAYAYAYDDECVWLFRKAKRTGSRYWWRRFYACVED